MLASRPSKFRNTPFGAAIERDHIRSALDLRSPTADAAPRRSPYEIFSLQPALDGLGVPSARAHESREMRRQRAQILYRAIGRLTWSVARLTVYGLAVRVAASIGAVSSRRR